MQPKAESPRITLSQRQEEEIIKCTGPAIVRLYGLLSDFVKFFGSGILVELDGTIYVVTAKHVIEKKLETDLSGNSLYEGMGQSTGSKTLITKVTTPIYSNAPPRDIAVARLPIEDLKQSDAVPINLRSVPQYTPLLLSELLIAHGYPDALTKTLRLLNGSFSRSFPLFACEEPCGCKWFDPKIHFAIGFPARHLEQRGILVEGMDPQGMSGCPVWTTNIVSRGSNWSSNDIQLIGMAIAWDMASQVLICVRIEYFWVLFFDVLQREFAYFRWIDRGMPPNDDQADWHAAKRHVRDLENSLWKRG